MTPRGCTGPMSEVGASHRDRRRGRRREVERLSEPCAGIGSPPTLARSNCERKHSSGLIRWPIRAASRMKHEPSAYGGREPPMTAQPIERLSEPCAGTSLAHYERTCSVDTFLIDVICFHGKRCVQS